MVFTLLSLLIQDGSLNVYDYGGNYNSLLKWLRETIPENIDSLTSINPGELCSPGDDHIVDITHDVDEIKLDQFQGFTHRLSRI
jgi:hypothetical protein